MKWYDFRKRVLPLVTPCLYYFLPYTKKTIGADVTTVIITEGKWLHQIILNKDFERSAQYFFDELQKDKDFLKKRLKQSREIAEEFFSFCRKKIVNLDKTADQELIQLLSKYYDYYQKFSVSNIAPWIFLTDRLTYIISSRLKNIVKGDVSDVFLTLTTTNVSSYIKKEEIDVLSLAIEIKEKQITEFSNMPKFKRLVDKYFWIPFDYQGSDLWDKKYYIKRIKELLSFELDILKKQKKEILKYQEDLGIKQKNLIKKFNISKELIYLIEGLKDLATLQDDKKAVTTQSHYYLQQLFKELSKRINLDYVDFYFLSKEEVEDVLLDLKDMAKIIKERKKLTIAMTTKERYLLLTGKEAKDYAKENKFLLPSQEGEEKVDELKGSTGSKGHAVGEIMIIETSKDNNKFKKGQILVAPMTTPDFVPIMKKAKAIITNEGGITCHAAIVSRELKIPCIIGTKIATKVLKDGDLVEVNADKGIVNIIKRK